MTLRGLPSLLLAAILAACGSGNSTGGTYSIARAPASGNDQVGAPNQLLASPLHAKVFDGSGQPAARVLVAWRVSRGQITDTSRTGRDGIASATWTLGDAVVARADTAFATVQGGGASTALFGAFAVPLGVYVVTVSNNAFTPASLTVPVQSKVAWLWLSDAQQHNVVPVSGTVPPSSGAPRDGPWAYQVGFADPGTYDYQCSVHGAAGMRGRITVSGGGPPPAPRR
jgi:plastocyanin